MSFDYPLPVDSMLGWDASLSSCIRKLIEYFLHALRQCFFLGDALFGGVLADVLADFHRASTFAKATAVKEVAFDEAVGMRGGWKEADHRLFWRFSGNGWVGNGEVGGGRRIGPMGPIGLILFSSCGNPALRGSCFRGGRLFLGSLFPGGGFVGPGGSWPGG
jgi:hypothetical protein